MSLVTRTFDRERRALLSIAWIVLVAPISAHGQADATRARPLETHFIIDNLQEISEAGVSKEEAGARGVSIPLILTAKGLNTWVIEISPADFHVPVTRDSEGRGVEWSLSSKASGYLALADGVATCRISVPLIARVEGEKEETAVPLTFTTERADRLGGTKEPAKDALVARSGSKLEPETGVVELVAAGLDPATSDGEVPKSSFTTLRGRVIGLPASLREAAIATTEAEPIGSAE